MITFDSRGNLKPYEKILLSLAEFETYFVASFGRDSSRAEIFARFKTYLIDFRELIHPRFRLWINGSFVRYCPHPTNLDFVIHLDHKIYEANKDILRSQFLSCSASRRYGVDAYLISLYPPGHLKYTYTETDLLYWEYWSSHGKWTKSRQRLPQGFIELNFY